jgi:hypothetical protein
MQKQISRKNSVQMSPMEDSKIGAVEKDKNGPSGTWLASAPGLSHMQDHFIISHFYLSQKCTCDINDFLQEDYGKRAERKCGRSDIGFSGVQQISLYRLGVFTELQ